MLVFTFLTGTCTALVAPAWQSIVPQVMPKENLGPAVAANSVGVNISRAVGPAVGGVAPPHELSRYWDETDIAFVSHHAAGFMGTRPSPVDMACHELSFEQSAS
ncbi:MAG: MFS transporter [Methylobacteriaceae bacterium]|nr:MFS transporter [Methylobacteriaceae bacterium]